MVVRHYSSLCSLLIDKLLGWALTILFFFFQASLNRPRIHEHHPMKTSWAFSSTAMFILSTILLVLSFTSSCHGLDTKADGGTEDGSSSSNSNSNKRRKLPSQNILLCRVLFSNLIRFRLVFTSAGCSHPLGLTNKAIEDWQLAASSARSRARDPECAVKHARLHSKGGRAWCAGKRHKCLKRDWKKINIHPIKEGNILKRSSLLLFSVLNT